MAAYNGGETAVSPSTEVGAPVDYRGPNAAQPTAVVVPDFSAAYKRDSTPISNDND